MATYYCDLSLDYWDKTGVNHTGDEYQGVGGLQAAIRGTGVATALVAGDILYLKQATGNLGRLVKLVCGKDVSGWALVDVVRNKTGSGDDWIGRVCELNVGAVNTTILVELDSGKTVADIDLADEIENITAVDDTTLASKACDGILFDTAEGDLPSGHIKIVGVKADWSTGNGSTDYCATLNAQSVATSCFDISVALDYGWLENLIMQNATADCMTATAAISNRWVIRYCIFENAGSDGIYGIYIRQSLFEHLVIRNNTAMGGNYLPYTTGTIAWSLVTGNGAHGAYYPFGGHVLYSVFSGNGDDHIDRLQTCVVIGCVFDGSLAGSGVYAPGEDNYIWGCRFSNNADHGIEVVDAANDDVYEDYNVFFNNANGDRQNCATGPNSRAAASVAECGYAVWSCTITYDGGTDMDLVNVGDAITDGAWAGTVKSITDGGAGTDGTVSIEDLSGGLPANNDAFTAGVGNALVAGTFSIDATTDYELTAAAIMAGTDAAAIDLDWTTSPEQTGYYTAGIPREYAAGGSALGPFDEPWR